MDYKRAINQSIYADALECKIMGRSSELLALAEAAEIIEAAEILDAAQALLEATGQYVYEEVDEKRLVLGSGGQSGNCEYCEEAADRGWIADDDVYEGPMGDEDGPPLHPNCDCTLEFRTRRVRVYV